MWSRAQCREPGGVTWGDGGTEGLSHLGSGRPRWWIWLSVWWCGTPLFRVWHDLVYVFLKNSLGREQLSMGFWGEEWDGSKDGVRRLLTPSVREKRLHSIHHLCGHQKYLRSLLMDRIWEWRDAGAAVAARSPDFFTYWFIMKWIMGTKKFYNVF